MTPSILNVNSVATMTSREIAELTGKEPDVTPDIFATLKSLGDKAVLSPYQADAFANRLVKMLMAAMRTAAEANPEELSQEDARARLDGVDEVRALCVGVRAMLIDYPSAHQLLDDVLLITLFAEATIVPALFMGNKDATARKNTAVRTYIMRSGNGGLIKIGKSIRPEERLKALQTGAGCELEILTVIDGDKERELHKKFAEFRVFGEWFSDSQGLIEKYAASRNQPGNFSSKEAV